MRTIKSDIFDLVYEVMDIGLRWISKSRTLFESLPLPRGTLICCLVLTNGNYQKACRNYLNSRKLARSIIAIILQKKHGPQKSAL